MKNLLTTGNPKIAKGLSLGYLTNILHLAPSKLSGRNVCPMASAGCAFACLNTAGRGGIIKRGETTNMIQLARIRKTDHFFNDRPAFMAQVVREVSNAIKLAEKHGLTAVFRLNGTSDIRWETIPVTRKGVAYANIMLAFHGDYSAIPNRKNLPKNYHLTFSRKESNDHFIPTAFNHNMNVAVVFDKVPTEWSGRKVINGDETDLRFLDAKGVIVGLKAKGKAKKDTTGFVVKM